MNEEKPQEQVPLAWNGVEKVRTDKFRLKQITTYCIMFK